MPGTRSLPDRATIAPYLKTILLVFGMSVLGAVVLTEMVDISSISGRVITDPAALQANLAGIESGAFFIRLVLNNGLIALMVITSAIFRTKFIPQFFIFWNGFVLTIYSLTIVQAIGSLEFLSAFLPHAVIEIPALLLAATYATHAVDRFRAEHMTWRIDPDSARWYLLIPYLYQVVPIIVVAAAIETFISLPVLKLVVGV
jgi:uncharacterized membrane protein SpoIIM required for sporulation